MKKLVISVVMLFLGIIFVFIGMFFLFPEKLGIILRSVYFITKTVNIPDISFVELEKIINFSRENYVSEIKKTESGFIQVNSNIEMPFSGTNNLKDFLSVHNISNVILYDKVALVSFLESNSMLGYSRDGWSNYKIGDIIGLGKYYKSLNDNWILLEECDRMSCPEISS